MNRLKPALYLLAVAIVASGCGRADGHVGSRKNDHTVTVARNWPAAEIQELRVFEIDGNVSIDAADTDQITLVAVASGELELKKGVENHGLFETTIDGDTLRIGRKERERKNFVDIPFLFGRRDMRINYKLTVPKTVSLALNTVNGRIATKGVDGETQAVTVNGTIDVETAGTNELRATTVNGRVRARFTESFQGARFQTVNGGVEAFLPQSASFTVNLSQVNGDFAATFPLSIHSNPGSRRVSGEVNGGKHELKIVTMNGDVELAQSGHGL
ncbi:MAG TPA: DUF4097 family beta strand repeat-containing protein [Thermoanaerobaculia bacterium]|nr:DUF4097 family beta strand repeat-containing protein [Thermoanaerobaculia bacterium]